MPQPENQDSEDHEHEVGDELTQEEIADLIEANYAGADALQAGVDTVTEAMITHMEAFHDDDNESKFQIQKVEPETATTENHHDYKLAPDSVPIIVPDDKTEAAQAHLDSASVPIWDGPHYLPSMPESGDGDGDASAQPESAESPEDGVERTRTVHHPRA